jgi:hypothetical protein
MTSRVGTGMALLAALAASALACAQSTGVPFDGGDADGRDADDGDDGAADRTDTPDAGCRPGQTDCSGICADLTTDPGHCGTCATACVAGEVCNEGRCASSCTGALQNCSGACVDLQTDGGHCGSCTNVCGPQDECRSGSCVCVPACSGRVCGDDGCRGSCGDCATGRDCGGDGRCFCPGNCVGRDCGDDGCGGTCGECTTGFSCTPAGTCACSGTPCGAACCDGADICLSGACCSPTWTASLPGVGLRGVARDGDGTLYVAGSSAAQAYVAAFDACGNRLRANSFPSGSSTTVSLSGLTLAGADVYVGGQTTDAGTDAGNGVWARMPKSTLVPTWTQPLWGGNDLDEIWAVAMTDTGDGWMAGTAGITATGSFPWVVRGTPGGDACGFAPYPASTGVGRDLALSAGRVWFAGARDGVGFVTSFASSECAFTPGFDCACTPSGTTVPLPVDGAGTTEARALAFAGADLLVAGYADVGGDLGGMVARVSGTVVTQAPRWNPTALIDGYTALAADASGAAVYAAGLSGWTGTGESGSAVLARYGVAGLTAEWQVVPSGAWICWDLVVDELGGIVVACVEPGGSSSLRRCLPSGMCP